MPIKDFYNSLHSDMKSILEKALQEDNLNDVAIAHSFMTDFGVSILWWLPRNADFLALLSQGHEFLL